MTVIALLTLMLSYALKLKLPVVAVPTPLINTSLDALRFYPTDGEVPVQVIADPSVILPAPVPLLFAVLILTGVPASWPALLRAYFMV